MKGLMDLIGKQTVFGTEFEKYGEDWIRFEPIGVETRIESVLRYDHRNKDFDEMKSWSDSFRTFMVFEDLPAAKGTSFPTLRVEGRSTQDGFSVYRFSVPPKTVQKIILDHVLERYERLFDIMEGEE